MEELQSNTAASGVAAAALSGLADASAPDLAQPFDELELRGGAGQLGQRFGLPELVDLAGERFLGALARGERRGLVQVVRARGRIRQHGDARGLHLERAAADVEGLFRA